MFLPLTLAVLDAIDQAAPLWLRHGMTGRLLIDAPTAPNTPVLEINGRPFPQEAPHRRFAPSHHDRLVMEQRARTLATAFDALQTALRSIPGYDQDSPLGVLLQIDARPHTPDTSTMGGNMCIEIAALCPSGTPGSEMGTLRAQGLAMAAKLDAALHAAQAWGTQPLHEWFIHDLADARGAGGAVRALQAPSAQDALLADGFWHWRVEPAHDVRRQASRP